MLITLHHAYTFLPFAATTLGLCGLGFFVVAIFFKNDSLGSIGLLYFMTFYLTLFIPYAAFSFIGSWYLYAVLLLLPWLIVKRLPNTRTWLRPAVHLDKKIRIFAAATVIFSTLALTLWFFFFKKTSLADSEVFQILLAQPVWLVFLVIVPPMALINGIAEEVFFRGAMQDALSALSPNLGLTLTLQA